MDCDCIIQRNDGKYLERALKQVSVRCIAPGHPHLDDVWLHHRKESDYGFQQRWCDDIRAAERMTLDLANRYLYWYYTRPTPFIVGHQQPLFIKRVRVRTVTETLVEEVE